MQKHTVTVTVLINCFPLITSGTLCCSWSMNIIKFVQKITFKLGLMRLHKSTLLKSYNFSNAIHVFSQDFSPQKESGGRGAKKPAARGRQKVRWDPLASVNLFVLTCVLNVFYVMLFQKASSGSDSESGSKSDQRPARSDSEDEKPRPAISGSESQSGSKSDSDSEPPPRKPQGRKKGENTCFATWTRHAANLLKLVLTAEWFC